MNEYLPTMLALVAGVVVHVVKKAAERQQADISFSLKDYLLQYPYQTFSLFGGAIGAYLALLSADSLTLSSAFLAGVAVNSMSGIAKGNR